MEASELEAASPPGLVRADFLESGLMILEEDLRLEENLRVDFIAMDASGGPVLISAFDGEEEESAPLWLLDLDIWFRENAFLLRQAMYRLEMQIPKMHWDREPRIFVVTFEPSSRFLLRLRGLALELAVFELRSILVKDERQWFLRGVAPWDSSVRPVALPSAPDGLEEPRLRELAERLLLRMGGLSPDLEIQGDRFHREVFLNGSSCLRLEAGPQGLNACFADGDEQQVVRTTADLDVVLDRVLRSVLDWEEEREGDSAWVEQQAPDIGAPEGGQGEPPLESSSELGGRLTDDEMEAFLNS